MWADGDAYELYVGRWSRLVARDFLNWVGAGPRRRWLDVGCGTGALSAAILAQSDPLELLGVDRSEAHVAWTAAHVDDARARFVVADADHLPDVTVDVVVSGLVLNFLPDAGAALEAMRERAPAYAMSLDEERRLQLRERLRAIVPVAEDGTVRLVARAPTVRGRVG